MIDMFAEGVAEAFREGTHALAVTRNVSQRDSRNRFPAADGEIIEIPAMGRRQQRAARDPHVQARQFCLVDGTLIATFQFQARQPISFALCPGVLLLRRHGESSS
jgi:hypothetical protein